MYTPSKLSIVPPKSIDDFGHMARLADALAAFHGEAFGVAPVKLQADHGDWYHAVLARLTDTPAIGFAGWYRYYDIHRATRGIELQNLFVEEPWRSHGIGFELVMHVAAHAVEQGCAQLRIGVRKDNARAIAFYTRLGCELVDRGGNWICRLDQAALRRLQPL